MSDQIINLILTLDVGSDGDDKDLELLTRQLRQELNDLKGVDEVSLMRKGELPEKAKAGDPITWGMLLMAFISGGGLAALISLLQDWIKRQGQGSVTVKLDEDELIITGRPTKQQQEAIDVWLRKHRGY